MKCYQELKARGFIKDETTGLEDLLNNNKITFYFGVDPTADSLTIGNYMIVRMAKILMKHGHSCIVLIGDLTAAIGDPSGKDEERQLLSALEIDDNSQRIKDQIRLIYSMDKNWQFSSNTFIHATMRTSVDLAAFLRSYGKYLTVGYMSSKTSVKKRIETGLSFTEFSYQLIQAADFAKLNDQYKVVLQIGGSDQWGNITSGIEMCRKKLEKTVHGITCPLLLKPNGEKFGKSSTGNIWLDPEKTTPWEMYQFFLGSDIDDSMLDELAMFFTELAPQDIIEDGAWIGLSPQKKRIYIAESVVKDIHGIKNLMNVQLATELLFEQTLDYDSLSFGDWGAVKKTIPVVIEGDVLTDNLNWLVGRHPLVNSKSDLQRHLKAESIKINGRTVSLDDNVKKTDLKFSQYAVLQVGKKNKILLCNDPSTYLE
jgi:tyrosyl-tRNA synthetase